MRTAGTKEGGQALLGGLDCTVQRNFFGAQINSFEADLPAPPVLRDGSGGDDGGTEGPSEPATYPAMFIRAPGILEAGLDVEVLSGPPRTDVLESSNGLALRLLVIRDTCSLPLYCLLWCPCMAAIAVLS